MAARAFDHAAQAGRPFLADRPGVFRARLADVVHGAEALPCAAAVHRRTAADHRRDHFPRPLRSSRPRGGNGAGAEGAALRDRAGRGRSVDRLGRSGRQGDAAGLVAGNAGGRTEDRRHTGAAFLRPWPVRWQPHAVGVVGDRYRAYPHFLQWRYRLLRWLRADW
ncbi:hypothetical protein D3C71_1596110 [compost metagenome]